MRDLLVVVPSRGRPASVARLWEAMKATCHGDTTLLVGTDADDPTLPSYQEYAAAQNHPLFQLVTRPDLRGVVAWVNELAVPCAGGYRFTGTIGDDNLPRTEGWDAALMEALGRTPLAFANDLYPREPGSHPAHIFCRSEVVAALGYLGPPQLKHMFVDNAWKAWGQACGITYLHDVVIEHLHFTLGRSPHDDTYQEAENVWDEDKAAWEAYQADGLAADIAKIRAVL